MATRARGRPAGGPRGPAMWSVECYDHRHWANRRSTAGCGTEGPAATAGTARARPQAAVRAARPNVSLGPARACRRLPALAHTSALSDSHADPNAPTANYGTGGPATAAGTARVPATGDRSRGRPDASLGPAPACRGCQPECPMCPGQRESPPRSRPGRRAAGGRLGTGPETARAPGRRRSLGLRRGDDTGAGPLAAVSGLARRRHGRRAAGGRSGCAAETIWALGRRRSLGP
jgi:hypothetical protein